MKLMKDVGAFLGLMALMGALSAFLIVTQPVPARAHTPATDVGMVEYKAVFLYRDVEQVPNQVVTSYRLRSVEGCHAPSREESETCAEGVMRLGIKLPFGETDTRYVPPSAFEYPVFVSPVDLGVGEGK